MGHKSRVKPIRETLTGGSGLAFTVEDTGIFQSVKAECTFDNLQPMLRAIFGSLGPRLSARRCLRQHRRKIEAANDQATLRLFDSLLPQRVTESWAKTILQWISIGRQLERIDVAPLEPYTLAGKRHAERNLNAAKKRALTQDLIEERVQAVEEELAKQARRGDRVIKEKAYAVVGTRFEVESGRIKQLYLQAKKKLS
jgi:hypothetical protein